MYPRTQAMIKEKQQAGVFSGAVYQFIEEQQETQVLGDAAILPEKEKMTVAHLFDVASLTKVICTTTVVLQLWEQAKINLDAPLQTYLPAFQNQQITIRHLLTHTSDIQTWIENRDQLSAEQLRAAYMTLQPGNSLGKTVCYTDAGTLLLGFMLEELFQRDLTDIFQELVLDPLQMTASQFPPLIAEKIVPTQKVQNQVLKGVTHDPKARVLGKHAGNAGLFTTVEDIHRFVEGYFNAAILKAATIEALMHDQTPDGKGKRSLGWDLKEGMLFHTGYTGTFLLIEPEKKQAFIFLSNRVHPVDNRESYLKERDEILRTYFAERQEGFML